MITEQDLKQAIAECQGERHPNASTCLKLAAFLIIQRELYGQTPSLPAPASYSYATGPEADVHTIDYRGESDFSHVIHGKRDDDIWAIMDEMMSTVQVVYPRLYDAVMAKLRG